MRTLRFLTLVLVLGIIGCVPRGIEVPDLSALRELPSEQASLLLQKMTYAANEVRSFRSRVDLEFNKPLGSELVTQVLVFERPDKLRSDFFEPNLTQLLLLLVVRDGQIKGVQVTEHRGFQGNATPENVAKLLSVPLSPEEMMLWFVGRYLPSQQTAHSVYTLTDSKYLAVFHQPDGSRSYVYFEGDYEKGICIQRILLQKVGDSSVVVDAEFIYDTQSAGGEIKVPNSIQVRLPSQDTMVVLTFRDPVVNPPTIREQLFAFPMIEGLVVDDLDNIQPDMPLRK